MPLEDLSGDKYLGALNRDWPVTSDPKLETAQIAGHLPGMKNVILNTFPQLNGPVDYTHTEISQAIDNSLSYTIPIGGGFPYFGVAGTLPANFLPCDGRELSRSTYSDLFNLIGTTYGSGDGSTTFNIPDTTGYSLEGESGNLGTTRGAETHTLTAAQSGLPAHSHNAIVGPGQMRGIDNAASDNDDFGGGNDEKRTITVTIENNDPQNAAESHPIVGPRLAMVWAMRVL